MVFSKLLSPIILPLFQFKAAEHLPTAHFFSSEKTFRKIFYGLIFLNLQKNIKKTLTKLGATNYIR